VKEDGMGRACSMNGLKRNAEGKIPLGNQEIDGWIVVKWINLALDRDQWRPLVNMVMNLWVP
jgi:hypothetical protein